MNCSRASIYLLQAASLCAAAAAFALPLAVWPTITDAAILPKWAVITLMGGIGGGLVLLAFALEHISNARAAAHLLASLSRVLIGILLIAAGGMLGPLADIFTSNPSDLNELASLLPGETITGLIHLAGLTGLLLSGAACGRIWPRLLPIAIASSMSIVILVHVLQILQMIPPYTYRSGSLPGNPAWLASWLAISIPPLITLISKPAGYALLSVPLLSLTATGAKAGILGAGAAFALLIPWKKLSVTPAMRRIMLLTPLLLLVPIQFLRYPSAEYRVYLLNITRGVIAMRPVTGSGLGTYQRNAMEFQSRWLKNPESRTLRHRRTGITSAHCDLLQLLAETGIVGLAGFLLIMSACWSGFSGKLPGRLMAASATALFVTGLFDFPFYVPASIGSFMLIIGWAHGSDKEICPISQNTADLNHAKIPPEITKLYFIRCLMMTMLAAIMFAMSCTAPLMLMARLRANAAGTSLALNQPDTAFNLARRSIQLWPLDHMGFLQASRALAIIQENDDADSEKLLGTALELSERSLLNRWSVEALELKAIILENLGYHQKAALTLDQVITGLNRGDHRRTRWVLTGMWLRAGEQRRAAESIAYWFTRFNYRNPGRLKADYFVQAHISLAEMNLAENNATGAADLLAAVIATYPEFRNRKDLQSLKARIASKE